MNSYITPVNQLSTVARLSVRCLQYMCKATIQNHKFYCDSKWLFLMRDGLGLKIGFFMGDCRIGLKTLGRMLGFWGESGIIIIAGYNICEVVLSFGCGMERYEVETCGCGKN